MSDLVTLYQVRVVDGYANRLTVASRMNYLHNKMMTIDGRDASYYFYERLRLFIAEMFEIGLITKRNRIEIERRLKNDFERKICTYQCGEE